MLVRHGAHVQAGHAVAEAARDVGDVVGAEVEGVGVGVASPEWSGIVGRLYVEPADAPNGDSPGAAKRR